jgi:hypothetical protein
VAPPSFCLASEAQLLVPAQAAAPHPNTLPRPVQAHVKPLVGHPAPDFTAEAVFDQEFIKVQLSKYRGKCVRVWLSQRLVSAC